MDDSILAKLLDAAKHLALEAGRAILAVAAEDADVTIKPDGSPQTRADAASNAIIVSGLSAAEPALPVVSEEEDPGKAAEAPPEVFWLIDPLDGTKEFIKGLGEYTVNVALIDRGEPVLGVVYVPAREELYHAAAGRGAWKAVAGGEPAPIHARQVDRPRSAVVSRSHLSRETRAFLDRLGVRETLPRGSSLKICAVAEGAADIYPRFGPTWLWDTAAGAAVAREAGCKVVDLAGKPLSYRLADGFKRPRFIVHPKSLDVRPGVH